MRFVYLLSSDCTQNNIIQKSSWFESTTEAIWVPYWDKEWSKLHSMTQNAWKVAPFLMVLGESPNQWLILIYTCLPKMCEMHCIFGRKTYVSMCKNAIPTYFFSSILWQWYWVEFQQTQEREGTHQVDLSLVTATLHKFTIAPRLN